MTTRQEPLTGRPEAAGEARHRLADHRTGSAGERASEDSGDSGGAGRSELASRPSPDRGDDQPMRDDPSPSRPDPDDATGTAPRVSGTPPRAGDDVIGGGVVGGEEAEEPRLTVAAVARRLGVAPATLRTWDRRYGLGPSDHASGRHRRYGPEDVARLEQMQRALLRGAAPAEAARYALRSTPPVPREQDAATGAADSGPAPDLVSGVLDAPEELVVGDAPHPGGRGLRLTGAGPRARGLGRAVLALDSWNLLRLLRESIDEQGVLVTWRDVLGPVVHAVSERWQITGAGVEALRLLTDCASTALRAVIAGAGEPCNPRPVVLAPVPGEQQELELVALAAELAARGVGHRLFGAGLPPEGLDAAVRRAAPAVVVLWAEQPHYADPGLLAGLPNTRQRARIFAAGSGWAPGRLPGHAEQVGSLEAAADRIAGTVLD